MRDTDTMDGYLMVRASGAQADEGRYQMLPLARPAGSRPGERVQLQPG